MPEVAPVAGEVIVDKPGKGAFYATNLDLVLRTHGITHLILTGITTDVCVHTTMREANDRGYECLILSDCTGATDPANHAAALHMVTMQGGVFGCVATSDDVISGRPPTALIRSADSRERVDADRPFTFDLATTALLVIDMQRDFLEPGGFGESARQRRLASCAARSRRWRRCSPRWRAAGLPVIHTREGHLPDLSDCPPAKLTRGAPSMRIGDPGPHGPHPDPRRVRPRHHRRARARCPASR